MEFIKKKKKKKKLYEKTKMPLHVWLKISFCHILKKKGKDQVALLPRLKNNYLKDN
jgi:hypothetical protein